MIPGALARRYARALLELAGEKRLEDKVLGEIGALAEVYHESTELRQMFASSRVPAEVRKKILDQILGRVMASDLTRKFVHHLDAKGRMPGIEDIHRSYKRMVDEKLGRVDAEVTTAAPIGMGEATRIRQQLEKITGKKIVLQQSVDPAIIGGAVTRVGHILYDGSVRHFLEEARSSLINET